METYKIKRHLKEFNITTVFGNASELDKYIKLGKDALKKFEM